MSARPLLMRGAAGYGGLWMGTAAASLATALVVPAVSDLRLVQVADVVLPVLFAFLAVALLVGVVLGWRDAKASPGEKILLTLLAVIFALPLLWAPVLGAVGAAWLTGAAIEYSSAYANFRIAVSNLLWPLIALFVSNALLETVWSIFEVAATVVGFFSALANVWPRVVRLFEQPSAA